MFIRTLLINSILFGLLSFNCFAQEVDYVTEFNDTGRVIMNEQLRKTSRRITELESGISLTTQVNGILPLANGGTGEALSDPGVDAFIYWDDSDSAMEFIEIGDGFTFSGNVVSVQSSGFNNIQAFTSSGTWTRPAGVDNVYVKVQGGGGGGGAEDSSRGGGGGGAGGYAEGFIDVSGNVTVTVGSGGNEGAGGGIAGSAGGLSRFAGDTNITGNGGGGGGSSASGGSAGSGGSASGGDINITGDSGDAGGGSSGGIGGYGGIPFLGHRGKGGYGGSNISYTTGGEAGTAGLVIVYWYE